MVADLSFLTDMLQGYYSLNPQELVYMTKIAAAHYVSVRIIMLSASIHNLFVLLKQQGTFFLYY